MEESSSEPKDVNLLFDKSKFSNLGKHERPEGKSTNLLLETFSDLRELNSEISLGKLLSLLNERSSSSSFLRNPISGGRYLERKYQ